jgi:hypothetical protein
MRYLKVIVSLVAALTLAQAANASIVKDVTLNFQSGAAFNGQVTFADNYSSYNAVNGVLSGGSYGTSNVTWIWSATNFSNAGANTFSNWLMNNSSSSWNYFITFGYHYNASGITSIFSGGTGYGHVTNVNYSDPLVSGSVSGPTNVPEPTPLVLFGLGVLALGAARKLKKA